MSHELIAIDWGTSSWRGALIAADGQVIEERGSTDGILQIAPGGFPDAWRRLCGNWLSRHRLCLISGMAGSRQGWVEAPYMPCPGGFSELADHIAWIGAEVGDMRVGIVPGMSCERDGMPDVMRGEELQIFGAAGLLGRGAGLYVLPGTHSKWASQADHRIQEFRTYMTGELYGLMRSQSILGRLMGPVQDDAFDAAAFRQGVRVAQTGGLLNNAFSTRTLGLSGQLAAPAMPSYLSGLLIGDEFATESRLRRRRPDEIVLVGSQALVERYAIAANELNIAWRPVPGNASWAGLWRLARTIG